MKRLNPFWPGLLCQLCIYSVIAEPFVPGDDRIQEAEILERIQREIGQDLKSLRQREVTKKEARKTESPTHLRLQLRSSGGKEYSGYHAHNNLAIRLNTATGPVDLQLRDVSSLTFEKFTATFVHYLEEEKKVRIFFIPDQCKAELRNGGTMEGRLLSRNLLQVRLKDDGPERTYSTLFWVDIDQPAPPASPEEMQALLARQAPEPTDLIKTIAVFPQSAATRSIQNED
ncbi:MAG: hypothetical protein HS115_07025 [Spirochaetales bacterium]|nr:hypothetical protein [Spirochaetales bacterium]